MPAPLVIAAHVGRQLVVRRLLKVLAVLAPLVLSAALAVWLLVAVVLSGQSEQSQEPFYGGSCSTLTPQSPVTVAGLTAEQVANAQVIVAVGRQLQVPAYGWVVAVATALQESQLRNLTYGDRDSLGLFQQRAGWGTAEERTNAEASSRMFYQGGRNGAPGLLQIPNFESMPLTQAAQAVQRSAFPGAYARWQALATQLVGNPQVLSATCLAAQAFQGDGTAGARAVQAAMSQLGTPYSWGGGGISGPTLGFGNGAGTVGFDCSALMQYAWHQATGMTLPRVSNAQAAALPGVPAGQPLLAGDLMFFHSPSDPPGIYHHVGMSDGQGNMVHAPRTGKTVEVVHDVLSNSYYGAQFAAAARPSAVPSSDPSSASSAVAAPVSP